MLAVNDHAVKIDTSENSGPHNSNRKKAKLDDIGRHEMKEQCAMSQQRKSGGNLNNAVRLQVCIQSGKVEFQCQRCRERFVSVSELKVHAKQKHAGEEADDEIPVEDKKVQKCQYCEETIDKHSSAKSYECEDCSCAFNESASKDKDLSNRTNMRVNDIGGVETTYTRVPTEVNSKTANRDDVLRAADSHTIIGRDAEKPSDSLPATLSDTKDGDPLTEQRGPQRKNAHFVDSSKIRFFGTDYKCRYCEEMLDRESALTTHTKETCKAFASGVPTCLRCEGTFTQAASLSKHIKEIHSSVKPYKCEPCGSTFRTYLELKKCGKSHQSTIIGSMGKLHENEECGIASSSNNLSYKPNIRCDICKQEFKSRSALNRHANKHRKTQALDTYHQCKYCEAKFNRRSNMFAHQKRHVNGTREMSPRTNTHKKPRCKLCHAEFPNLRELRNHRLTHQERHVNGTNETAPRTKIQKKRHCKFCHAEFANLQELRDHRLTHREQKRFTCAQCDKGFTEAKSLRYHMRIHSGERPYQCHTCGKMFTMLQGLKVHERVHSGDRPFKCSYCDKGFTTSNDRVRHERTHTGDKPYKCDECPKAYSTNGQLTIHKRLHTGDRPFACDFCGMAFTNNTTLKFHKRKHVGVKSFGCETCDLCFYTDRDLREHTRRRHTDAKRFQCMFCGETFHEKFELRDHERSHTGETPHLCEFCGEAFARAINLRHHRKVQHSSGDSATTPIKV